MANNHNNGIEPSQCLCHAILSEPRPEFYEFGEDTNMLVCTIYECERAKLKRIKKRNRARARASSKRMNKQTNETALGSSKFI